jgi:hypothetical protein
MSLAVHHRVNQDLHPHPVGSWLEYDYLVDGVTLRKKSLPRTTVPVRSTPGFCEWILPCALVRPLTRYSHFIHSISRMGSQHDGERPCFIITFQRDHDQAGHGHREDRPQGSQNPSPEDQ